MTDIILEVLRAIIVGAIVFFLITDKEIKELRQIKGWNSFLYGFILLLFGSVLDITDNFESLNVLVVIGDTPIQAVLEKIVGYLFGFVLLAIGISHWIPEVIELKNKRQQELEKTQEEVGELRGLLPICSSCKKIRDDQGYWDKFEHYIAEHTDTELSHCICPACAKKLYPEIS